MSCKTDLRNLSWQFYLLVRRLSLEYSTPMKDEHVEEDHLNPDVCEDKFQFENPRRIP